MVKSEGIYVNSSGPSRRSSSYRMYYKFHEVKAQYPSKLISTTEPSEGKVRKRIQPS